MKLKIISDGTPTGTKVVDQKTNEELEDIKSISWSITHSSLAIATIELYMHNAEFEVKKSDTKTVIAKKKRINTDSLKKQGIY